MNSLRRRRTEVLLPEKVAEEVKTPGYPLERFLDRYPNVISTFSPAEEDKYLEIRVQPGIHDGEAAAITIALSRGLPLVIGDGDKKGRSKAENHGIRCLSWQEFVQGAYI